MHKQARRYLLLDRMARTVLYPFENACEEEAVGFQNVQSFCVGL